MTGPLSAVSSALKLLLKCLGPGVAGVAVSMVVFEPCLALQITLDQRPDLQGEPLQSPRMRSGQTRSTEFRLSGATDHGDRGVAGAGSGSIRPAETDSADGLAAPAADPADTVGSALSLAQYSVDPLPAGRPNTGFANPHSQGLGEALVAFLVLGLGLGSLLLWRQGWFRRRRWNRSDRGGEWLLPPPRFRPRTPHERLHDPVYLRRMLEAEQLVRGQRDGVDTKV